MKRILVIAGKLYIGGAELVCRNIGYYADPEQFRVDYLVFGDTVGAYEPELREKGCQIWHIPSPRDGYRRFYTQLKTLIRKNHYDVVHCHTMFNSGLVLLAAKRCGVPVRIAHSHSIRGPEKRSPVQNAYEETMRRLILRSATHYVGCGQAAGEWLFGEKAFRERGILLLNGINLDRFAFNPAARDQIRRELGWEDCFIIGHAGHLAPVKNQRFLLDRMPELLKRRPETRLILLGDGTDRPMLEQRIRDLKLEGVVHLPGNVMNVNEYLSAMDVFAFPSLYEGMPLAILEVQANGLPCVLSDRVPKDVLLTDLVTALPLEDTEAWIDVLSAARRKDAAQYVPLLQASGFDVGSVLERIYALYRSTAVLSFSFDDGRLDSIRAAEKLLFPRALPASFCITTGYVDGSCPARLLPTKKPPVTLADLRRLAAEPLAEIAMHGNAHLNTEEDLLCCEAKLRNWLQLDSDTALGFASPDSGMSLARFRSSEAAELREHMLYLRTGLRIRTKKPLRVLCRKAGRIFRLPLLYRIAYHDTIMTECDGKILYSVPIMRDVTVPQVLAVVRDCVKRRGALVLTLHSVEPEPSDSDVWSWREDKLERLCEALSELQDRGLLQICTSAKQFRLLQERI